MRCYQKRLFWGCLLGAVLAWLKPNAASASASSAAPRDGHGSARHSVFYTHPCLLEAERSGYYQIVVLTFGDQTLVLAGEEHLKPKIASEIGKTLVDCFDTIAVEGLPLKQTNYASTVAFFHSLDYVLKYGFAAAYPSTMEVAEQRSQKLPAEDHRMASLLWRYEQDPVALQKAAATGLFNAEQLTEHERATLDDMGFADVDSLKELDFHRLYPALRSKLIGESREVIHLELFDPYPPETHDVLKAMLKQKQCLQLVGGSCTLLATALSISQLQGLAPGIIPERPTRVFKQLAFLATAVSSIYTAYQLSSQADLQGIMKTVIDAREAIMAKRLYRAMVLRPDRPVLLGMVGSRHLAGLTTRLISAYGFKF